MSARTEIEAALADEDTGISVKEALESYTGDLSVFAGLEDAHFYFGSRTRMKRHYKEVRMTWAGRERVGSITGRRYRNQVAIEIFMAANDRVQPKDAVYEEEIKKASRQIVDFYDMKESQIAAVLTNQVDLVRCYETDAYVIMPPTDYDSRTTYSQILMLEIDTWE